MTIQPPQKTPGQRLVDAFCAAVEAQMRARGWQQRKPAMPPGPIPVTDSPPTCTLGVVFAREIDERFTAIADFLGLDVEPDEDGVPESDWPCAAEVGLTVGVGFPELERLLPALGAASPDLGPRASADQPAGVERDTLMRITSLSAASQAAKDLVGQADQYAVAYARAQADVDGFIAYWRSQPRPPRAAAEDLPALLALTGDLSGARAELDRWLTDSSSLAPTGPALSYRRYARQLKRYMEGE